MAWPIDRKVTGRKDPALPQKKRVAVIALLIFTAIASVSIAAAVFFTRSSSTEKLFSYSHLLMDTDVTLMIYCGSPGEAGRVKEALFAEMSRLEHLLSYTDLTSDVTRINCTAGKSPAQVSPETVELIEQAKGFAALSEGAFDPTVAPLLEIWGFRGEHCRVPAAGEIEAAKALIDYSLIGIDTASRKVFLSQPGAALDLGGIAKGYIIDRGLDLLSRAGIGHALINAGGDIGILGPKPDGSPWRIGVRHPRSDSGFIAVIPWKERGAVVTSGDYERFFEENGVRYHHILDPRSGYPARDLVSVTVIAPTAVEADALSTAIFVLGPQRGLALVDSLPGVEAILVTPQFELLISDGIRDLVELTGES